MGLALKAATVWWGGPCLHLVYMLKGARSGRLTGLCRVETSRVEVPEGLELRTGFDCLD